MKTTKLQHAELLALLQFRENLEGGDPDMGMVSGAIVRTLEKRGLIASAYYPTLEGHDDLRRRVFERSHIPTRRGLEVLEALTYGPHP